MNVVERRRDRTARLVKLQTLLLLYPNGLKIEEIARRCSISKKTTYRDLKALEYELDVPIWEEGSKRGIAVGHYLPPIKLTLEEALNIFLSIRLMQKLTTQYPPSVSSAFTKLAAVVPLPLKEHIQKIVEYMEKQPRDERKARLFNKIAQAWLSHQPVKILYQESSIKKPVELIIEPYFIEPLAPGGGNYVIAYRRSNRSIRGYKLSRIIGEVHIEDDVYNIPPDFNYDDWFGLIWPWDNFSNEDLVTVKMRFSPRLKGTVTETLWHSSQITKIRADSSVIMTLRIPLTANLRWWILGWGDGVEVLEPEILRNQITEIAQSLLDIYAHRKQL
jgi:predicted DNA-binding transcriptional regulator YafY